MVISFAGSCKRMGENFHCVGYANAMEAADPNHQHFINSTAASTTLVGV